MTIFKKPIVLISLTGIVAAIIFANYFGNPPLPKALYASLPVSIPFDHAVSGTGIIEPNSLLIRLGSHSSGIVKRILIKEGDNVKKDQVVLELDDEKIQSTQRSLEQEVELMKIRIQKASVDLDDETRQLKRIERLKVGVTISVDELQKHQFAVKRAQVLLDEANQSFKVSKARLGELIVDRDRLQVKSPVDGTILKIYVRPGESVQGLSNNNYLMALGHLHPLYIRVQIDEYDLDRFDPNARALAFLKGNGTKSFPLRFVRLEPYTQPKSQLSGDQAERVDTRILEAIYEIDGPASLHVGQQLDVFIEIPQNPS